MSPEQRENKNKWLREWRKKKRQADPVWRKKQAEYASSYSKRRRNDGTDFDQKRKDVGNAYYQRLIQTDEGRQRVRESARRAYRNTVMDAERKAKLREKERKRSYQRKRTDPEFAIKCHLRARLADLIGAGKCKRDKSAIAMTGASVSELRRHFEKQFKLGMSWKNYGEWHIDHIIPCAMFDLTDPRQQAICFNYLNLRPCWATENIRKGNRLTAPAQLPLGL